jgi:hypothetical protein
VTPPEFTGPVALTFTTEAQLDGVEANVDPSVE